MLKLADHESPEDYIYAVCAADNDGIEIDCGSVWDILAIYKKYLPEGQTPDLEGADHDIVYYETLPKDITEEDCRELVKMNTFIQDGYLCSFV